MVILQYNLYCSLRELQAIYLKVERQRMCGLLWEMHLKSVI